MTLAELFEKNYTNDNQPPAPELELVNQYDNKNYGIRRYLQHRRCWVIPMGGSSWLGAVGFVNAGLELAQQITAGEIPAPSRIYMANGTMGSSVGLSLGLALAELPIDLHAVRVVDERFASPAAFRRSCRDGRRSGRPSDSPGPPGSTPPCPGPARRQARWRRT